MDTMYAALLYAFLPIFLFVLGILFFVSGISFLILILDLNRKRRTLAFFFGISFVFLVSAFVTLNIQWHADNKYLTEQHKSCIQDFPDK